MGQNSATEGLVIAVDQFVQVCAEADGSFSYFSKLAGYLNLLVGAIFSAEETCNRQEILAVVAPARAIMARSSFLARLQSWPRGYQGDFETIEHLIEQKNSSEPNTAHYWLEQHVLGSTMSQQHRNKISMQAMEIMKQAVLARHDGRRRRILVIACGSSADIYSIKDVMAKAMVDIVINDIDEDALAFSLQRLEGLGDRITVEHGNILLKLRELKKQKPFDLILTGGLYDYLTDAQASKLTRFSCANLLNEGGAFVFTNLSTNNPVRSWMEYLVDWHMNYRTEESIDAMLASHGVTNVQVEHVREKTDHAIITRVMNRAVVTEAAE